MTPHLKRSKSTNDKRLETFSATLTKELEHVASNNANYGPVIAAMHQLVRHRKKMRWDGVDLSRSTVLDFIKFNDSRSGLAHSLPESRVILAREYISDALEAYTRSESSDSVQCSLSLGLLFRHWSLGPGASIGHTGSGHFVEKLRQPEWTVTPRAKRLAEMFLNGFDPRLNGTDAASALSLTIVRGSSLSTVPKNEETDRTICTEPLANMALQLAAGRYIEGALKLLGYHISKGDSDLVQSERNRDYAWLGSLTGLLHSFDLKSASDCISESLIRAIWPREWYELFMTLRSEETCTPDGNWVRLNMVSTMGNGFTFPMMTLTILALFVASLGYSKVTVPLSTFQVFGDDIIVHDDYAEELAMVLSWAGFIINTNKSYTEGRFRESCGGDFFMGMDITPFYVKSLDNDPAIYIAIDQLVKWSTRTSIVLRHTMNLLLRMLPKRPFFVPEWCEPYNGIRYSGCPKNYNVWRVRKRRSEVILFSGDILSVVGGYLQSCSRTGSAFYFARQRRIQYFVARSSLPKGWLDGSAPDIRCREERSVAHAYFAFAAEATK